MVSKRAASASLIMSLYLSNQVPTYYDQDIFSVIAVLFIAISYELHQIGDVNLYAWYGFGGLMVVLRTIRAVQLSKL
jgi:hypothetical protein